jgi:hypothetical protein
LRKGAGCSPEPVLPIGLEDSLLKRILRRMKNPARPKESELKKPVAGELHSCRSPRTAVLEARKSADLGRFEKSRLNFEQVGLQPRHSGQKKKKLSPVFSQRKRAFLPGFPSS